MGLTLIGYNFQYIFERFTVYLFLFWESSPIRKLIIKNLGAHRLKNRRTALMYSISVAFVIFVWTTATVEIRTTEYTFLRREGSDLTIEGGKRYRGNIPMFLIDRLVEGALKNYIEDYAFITSDLEHQISDNNFQNIKKGIYIQSFGKIQENAGPKIYAVSQNFLKVVDADTFLTITQRE